MSESADDILRRMQSVRRSASDDVRGIVESAKTLSDWRFHVQHHPWLCVGAAAALGFVLAPKSRKVSTDNTKELAALLKRYNIEGSAGPAAGKGLTRTLIGMATPFVLRTVMQAAQQHFAGGDGPWSTLFGNRGGKPDAGDAGDRGWGLPPDHQAFHDVNIPR